MDTDDDNVSFLSISDSDDEITSVRSDLCGRVTASEVPRASSPAISVRSVKSLIRRSTPKRQAPQPPPAPSPVSPRRTAPLVTTEEMSKVPLTLVREEIQRSSECIPKIFVVETHSSMVGNAAEETVEAPTISGLFPDNAAAAYNNPRNFSHLPIRMIDDEVEPFLKPALPASDPFPTLTEPSLPAAGPTSQLSPVYTTFFSQQPEHYDPSITSSPMFFTSSVHLTSSAAAMPHMQPCASSLGAQNSPAQFVSAPSFHVLPQMPTPTGVIATAAGEEPQPVHPLLGVFPGSHYLGRSASDVTLNQLVRRPYVAKSAINLGNLAEDKVDDVFESDDTYETVAGWSAPGELTRFKQRHRVTRSDSNVTVGTLYEDIIVSPRFKLKLTLTNLTVVAIAAVFFVPNSAALIYSAFRLVFGTLFPAYYSYKAVRTKNVKEYVKWMMYWIVFAFFTCVETITDVFLSFWFPFYYEIKILVVLWLLSPATRGSSILYRKFVHPWLTRREDEIDECIAKAKQQGYSTVVQLGTKGVNYATNIILQTAIKGGGGLVSQLKRSYSTSEISEDTADHNSNVKSLHPPDIQTPPEDDDRSVSSGSYESEPRLRTESEGSSNRARGHSTGRAVRANKTRSADVSEVYIPEPADAVVQRRSPRIHDVMSASAGGGISQQQTTTRRSRTEVSSYATLPRTASKRAGAVKKRQA